MKWTFFLAALPFVANSAWSAPEWMSRSGVEMQGFLDARAGARTSEDPVQDEATLLESRAQLDMLRYGEVVSWEVRSDFLYDHLAEDHSVDLQAGTGWVDLREAHVSLSPAPMMDVKAGRQIITWGTGDLLFVNDLFSKDWKSFFIGRDEEYLKAPSDVLRLSVYPGRISAELVYAPRFDPDRFLDGERISYFNPMTGGRAGEDQWMTADIPDDSFEDDEISARVYGNAGSFEGALYAYNGFWKSPGGFNETGSAIFPALSVYGASLRGPLGPGLVNLEGGYYDSQDDRSGSDPLVRNSETRLLAGFEREVLKELTAGAQYYAEIMHDHARYESGLPAGSDAADEVRQVLTLRLTQLLMNQNLRLTVFTFYSPTDQDVYIRPAAFYKVNDQLQLSAGGNLFAGEEETTFFGQFEDNSNLYASMRYSF